MSGSQILLLDYSAGRSHGRGDELIPLEDTSCVQS